MFVCSLPWCIRITFNQKVLTSGYPSFPSPQIGNPNIINAVLQMVSQEFSARNLRKDGIPGLIITRLREVEHGLPQIHPDVNDMLMAHLGVEYNYRILDLMSKVSFICFVVCMLCQLHKRLVLGE